MQVGTESRTKVIVMLALALLGVFLLVRAFTSSDNVTAAPSTTPTARAAQPVRSATQVKKLAASQQSQSLDPTIRLDLLRTVEEIKYEGKGRNIFKAEVEAPPVQVNDPNLKCKVTPDAPGCPGYDPCKANPTIKGCPLYKEPINLKFFGFANRPGERKKVFLSQGEDVFIAGEGDTVNRRYRVVHIGVNSVDIKDVLNDNTQTIPLTQG
jgi:hypothetical protein